jgi:selenocysteine lyase/cysteine desulfurase
VADDAEIEGTIYGGTGVRSAYPYHLEEYPYRLEAGTLNMAGIAGLSAGVGWVKEKGVENIHAHEIELLSMLQDGFSQVPGVTIHGTKSLEDRVPTLSVSLENYDAADVGTFLDVDYDILTRTGLHCAPLIHEHYGTAPRGTVRFSVGPFNTEEHILKAVKAVEAIQAQRPSNVQVAPGMEPEAGFPG